MTSTLQQRSSVNGFRGSGVLVFLALAACVTSAGATDLHKGPIQADGLAKPNVIFGMDDSGSMDSEVMINTNDGAFWWDHNAASGWNSDGTPWFNAIGDATTQFRKMVYLFPNGTGAGERIYGDLTNDHFAIAPTPQFAWLRSAAYNPLYYNPVVSYVPWAAATVSGTARTFANSNAAAALSHPLYSSTLRLDQLLSSSVSQHEFKAFAGMKLPIGTVVVASTASSGACEGNTTRTLVAELTVAAGRSCSATIPYYPASYWVVNQACVIDGSTCVQAPDGSHLKLHEIKSGNVFPSGRSYADELQNFANWFTYYRKRKLMLSASMGQVMGSLSETALRVGLVRFNSLTSVTMFETDSTNAQANGSVIAGSFYSNPTDGGTPTRATLKYIGEQYRRTTAPIVQYSCQRNAAFIVTDGFADSGSVTPPSYSASLYGSGSPYQTTYAGTLADIALSYYTNVLVSSMPAGRVPAAAANSPDPAADRNSNLHMNTYAISLGARGTLWPNVTDAYAGTMTWPNPSQNRSPTSVDDLWHATINGRGSMFRASTPDETASSIQMALTEIMQLKGAQSGIAYRSVNIRGGPAVAYVVHFRPRGWTGDVEARSVDLRTGLLSDSNTWAAQDQLTARDWTTRKIFSYSGSQGVTFTDANVGTAVAAGNASGSSSQLVEYLRGDRTEEGALYRARSGLLGAIVNSEPASSIREALVFAASNDGMLHAFDMATGEEAWAYAPRDGLAGMGAQSKTTWQYDAVLDGTPGLTDVDGKTILVAGRGSAGPGFYALDVTASRTLSEAQLAAKVLWEFPNTATPASVRAAIGASTGKPVVVKTARYGWVALVTSGYNSTLDGKGRVFVLDLATGAVQHTFVTTEGSVGAGDAGLAQLSGYLEGDRSVRYAYGGDELGHLWRFDIEESSIMQLASLVDSGGASLPVTSAPELATLNGRRMVFVGTGRLLGMADFSDTRTQSFFGLWDNNLPIANVRTALAPRTMTVTGTTRQLTGSAIDWATKKGWYFDLPAGEKANTDPAFAYGMVTFTTNRPAATTCSSTSVLYFVDAGSGLELADGNIAAVAYAGIEIGGMLTSRPVVARLGDGSITITTHQSDDTISTQNFRLLPLVVARKNGWREVIR